MKYTNLIDKMTELDKEKLVNFINAFGVKKDRFIGVEEWLQSWSHAKQRLYKLLGENLSISFPISINKNCDLLQLEIISTVEKMITSNLFIKTNARIPNWSFSYFIRNRLFDLLVENSYTSEAAKDIVEKLFPLILPYSPWWIDDRVELFGKSIKIKKLNSKKTLQISNNMKPIKAFLKILEYFKEEAPYYEDEVEKFRIEHSMILNDKTITGNLVISINPIDYISMSDTTTWHSCMSWEMEGGYRAGTIEMMNSNNILCCYIESEKNNFIFDKDAGVAGCIPDKKWRALVCATKDILLVGKSYPFNFPDIDKTILTHLRKLAKNNWNKNYQYGIEQYHDMRYVYTIARIENNRDWIAYGIAFKHNIILDTKEMYNDFLNDNTRTYYCCRNVVKRNKVLSISGKCRCLQCNRDLTEENRYYVNHYPDNERYRNCGQVLCKSCRSKEEIEEKGA